MKKIVLALIGIIIGFLIIESFLWIQAERRERESSNEHVVDETPSLYEYDSLLGWRMSALSSARQKNPEFDATYQINAQGFRDERDYFLEKSDKKRIIIFGDSFTFGVGVKNEDTFSKVLEKNADYEVMNFGVSGYDVGQYFLSLKETGLKYDPDAVVFAIYIGNDVEDVILSHPFQSPRFKPYFKMENGNFVLKNNPVPLDDAEYEGALMDYRIKNVFFYNKIKWLFDFKTVLLGKNLIKQNFYPFLERLGLVKSLADYEENFSVIQKTLEESRKILGDRELTAIIIPSKNIKHNYLEKELGKKIGEILIAGEIPFVDLIPGAIEDGNFYFSQEGHFNERGHKFAAQRLREIIASH